MERKVECGGCESFMPESRSEPLANTNFPLATKPSQGSAQCTFRLVQSFQANGCKPAFFCGGLYPARGVIRRPGDCYSHTHTHRGQGASLGRLGKYAAHPPTGAQHIGRAFWAGMGGRALVGSGWKVGGESWTNLHPRRDAVHQIGSMQSVFVTC